MDLANPTFWMTPRAVLNHERCDLRRQRALIANAVRGGKLYGQFPTLALDGPDDAGSRGVLIPTTSVAQIGATLATWFGAPQSAIAGLFPNLAAFPADQQNLQFML